MIDRVSKDACTGCGSCAAVCPASCIALTAEQKGGVWFPLIDFAACIRCQKCESVCPALRPYPPASTTAEPVAFAAYANDGALRQNASSGGVFPLLARHVLEQGGAVFGAAWQDGEVVHRCVEAAEGLPALSGSKYVQSHTAEAFPVVKRLLEERRLVYFSGTPCQVAGLLGFLGRPYERLICQDLVCHGVPVPWLWRAYRAFLEEKFRSPPASISFKDKQKGTWTQYFVTARFENGQTYAVPFQKDPYMQLFLSDVCLRPACYACQYKGPSRQADLTLADFWGVDKVLPAMKSGLGVSLVLLHSAKGRALFDEVLPKLTAETAPNLPDALAKNPAALFPAQKPNAYAAFWEKADQTPFSTLAAQFGAPAFRVSLARQIRRLAGKLYRKLRP